MRTPRLVPLVLALAPLASLLAGCGDTLVDHNNTAIQEGPGGGATCGPNLVACGDPAAPVCRSQNVNDPNGYVCGTSCQPCGAPPNNATVTCTPIGDGGHDGVCGFDCAAGFLKSGNACAAPALVAAGDAFSCATAADTGEVHCWGANDKGQLGPGVTGASRSTSGKVQFAALANVIALAAGHDHACAAVGNPTTVYCWGDATGFGGAASSATPVAVPALDGSTVLAAGANHTCGIASGALKCVGAGTSGGGSPALGGAVVEIAAGDDFSCALVDDGTATGAVKCWGANDFGQRGTGSQTGPDATPFSVPFPAGAPAGLALSHVAAGARHACAGTNDTARSGYAVFCWGDNRLNQLGADASGTFAAPTPLLKLNKNLTTNARPTILEGGGAATCAVKSDGTDFLTCWGADDPAIGGVAPGPGETVDVTSLSPPGRFSMGAGHGCIVNPAGLLSCWGHNESGQLGNGNASTPVAGTSVLVIDR